MKLYQIMIYIVVVGLVVATFMHWVGAGVEKGYVESNNDTRIDKLLNSTQEMYLVTEQTKNDLQELQGSPNVLDILGTIVSGAYGALKSTAATYNTAYQVTAVSTSYLPLGGLGDTFTNALGIILLILIFVGIILAAYIKSDRI